MRRPWRKYLAFALLLPLGAGSGISCRRHIATDADCVAIIDRLVEIELTESGFRDPVVRDRWKAKTRTMIGTKIGTKIGQQLSFALDGCRGRRVPDNLATCLSRARSPEEIAHVCLR